MEKSDKSKKNICIAAIKRHAITPFDFKFTRIYDLKHPTLMPEIKDAIHLESEEELICSTYVSPTIWTLLTTRRIFSLEGVGLKKHELAGIKKWDFGDFKGYSKQPYTKGFLYFENSDVITFFIETQEASMVMIYGIRTMSKLSSNPD